MQELIDWLNIEANTWVAQVFFVVLATVVINFIMKLVLERVHRRFERTDNLWDDAVLQAARRPLAWLVWVIGLSIAAEIIQPIAEK